MNTSIFTEQELTKINKNKFYSVMADSQALFSSSNGGFGYVYITKENDKIIYFSSAPNDWDVDDGKVYSYRTYKIQYETIDDFICSKNGIVLIDEIS